MITSRLLLAGLALVGLLLATGACGTDATPAPPPDVAMRLPEPAGPAAVGTTFLALRDPQRVGDGAPGPRELVTQLWYPTDDTSAPLAPYAPPGELAALAASYPVPPGAFAQTVTHAHRDAPARPGAHPLVLLSHGLCGMRTDLTGLAERLASEGFAVAATGATGESPAVQFPDGHVVGTTDRADCRTAADSNSPAGIAVIERLQRTRVADQRFVLATLLARPDVPVRVDPDRVAAVGHSFGGSTSAQLALEEPRVRAAVDLDGFVHGPVRTAGLSKPLLMLGSDYHSPEGDPTWAQVMPRLTGWHQWLRVRGAGHYRFIDLGGSAERWGLRAQMDPETWRSVFGDVDPEHATEIPLAYTSAFLHRFLLGAPAPLLDGPSPAFGEVEFR